VLSRLLSSLIKITLLTCTCLSIELEVWCVGYEVQTVIAVASSLKEDKLIRRLMPVGSKLK
jgi:hypothetical protein